MFKLYEIEIITNPTARRWYLGKKRSLWSLTLGMLHRDYNLHAIIERDGYKWWYKNGEFHRGDNKPAIVEIY